MQDNNKKATATALNILAYAPCTQKTLCLKLAKKGFSTEEIKNAVVYVTEHGYLNERDFLLRTVYLRAKAGYGRRRVLQYIREKGFSRAVIEENFDTACEEIDFVGFCRERIRKTNKGDPEKLMAALLRYGYDYPTIKKALKEEINSDEEE